NIQCYINKSKIQNTDACTQKWVRNLQEYRNKKSISYNIQTLNDKKQLVQVLCEFFADMKHQDQKPYKAESIVSAYTSLRHYLFETSAIMNVNTNGRFQFPILYHKLIIENWFSKDRLEKNTLGNMMKEIACTSGINITDQRITNHLERRIAIQLLLDLNVNEHEMMQFLGHHSTDELSTYKIPSNEQQFKNSTLLLDAIQESLIVQQEESQQEESQVMQQEESQVMQQESQVIQQESQVMQQYEFQILQQDEFQARQFKKSQKIKEIDADLSEANIDDVLDTVLDTTNG
ncbi:1962_t:CDS:2, partial [Gigaspora rosea]